MNTPNHIKNYSTLTKKSSLRLLPGERIGLCLADDNLSAHQDSIQGRPGIGLFIARFPVFFMECSTLGEHIAINRLPCGRS